MVRTYYKYYYYRMDGYGNFETCDPVWGVPLEHFIGDTLASLMRNNECPLEMVRLNFGEGGRVAVFRRIADIKVTVGIEKRYE